MTTQSSNSSRGPLAGLCLAAAFVASLSACTSTSTFQVDDSTDPTHLSDGEDSLGNAAPTVRTLHSAARICASRGQDSEAELCYAELIKRHPTYMPGYTELSELYLRNEMLETAMAVLNKGLEVQPDDAVLHNDLGMCHLFDHDYDAALEQFIQAASLSPEDARSRANMAVSLAMLGRMDEAYANYQLIVPEDDARSNMALLSEVTGFAWSPPEPPQSQVR